MRELPILFSTDMVKAILDGRKTMTRRAVKPQPTYITTSGRWTWPIPKSKVHQGCCTDVCTASREWWEYLAPDQMLYNPGDILWVRETWWRNYSHEYGRYWYRADGEEIELPTINGGTMTYGKVDGLKWSPSIHMPKAAARIWLEVTDVRVERLSSISEADAKAEGVGSVEEFRHLWNTLNGKGDYSWLSNPWVWIISFKIILN